MKSIYIILFILSLLCNVSHGLKISVNFDTFLNQTSSFNDSKLYYQQDIYPIIQNYVLQTFNLRASPPNNSIIVNISTCAGITLPNSTKKIYNNTDVVILLGFQNATLTGSSATTYVCQRQFSTSRPTVFLTRLDPTVYAVPGNDTVLHERSLLSLLHETFHGLGHTTYDFWTYYPDENGNPLRDNIYVNVTYASGNFSFFNSPYSTPYARKYFGCSTLPGIPLENQNGNINNTTGHLEKTWFPYEFISQGNYNGMLISPFPLYILNASGWYSVNVSMVDQYSWGKSQGCSLFTSTHNQRNNGFSEYCNTTGSNVITPTTRIGAQCRNTSLSNLTMFGIPVYNTSAGRIAHDCADPLAQDALQPNIESYGTFKERNGGFLATIRPNTTKASTIYFRYCFNFSCGINITSPHSYTLNVTIANITKQCLYDYQNVTIPGYVGVVKCPGIQDYCLGSGFQGCPRGCMGKGSCDLSSGQAFCKCQAGYIGYDCSIQKNSTHVICGKGCSS